MDKPLFTFNSDVFRVIAKLFFWLAVVYLLNVIFYLAISNCYLRLSGGVSGAKISATIRQKHDVFIFGASRGLRHYNSGIISNYTGLSVYNAADDGKSPAYQLGLLTLLLEQHKPRAVIYEVGDIMSVLARGDVDLYPYYYSNKDVRLLLNKKDPFSYIKFRFKTYAYNQRIFTGIRGLLPGKKTADDGYRPLYGCIKDKDKIEYRDGFEGPDDFSRSGTDTSMIENFRQFISVCESNQIQVIFAFSPTLTGYHATCERLIRSIALEKKIPFFDYSSDMRFKGNRKLFKDVNHLNDEGATLFSNDIGEKLKKLFADRTKDANN